MAKSCYSREALCGYEGCRPRNRWAGVGPRREELPIALEGALAGRDTSDGLHFSWPPENSSNAARCSDLPLRCRTEAVDLMEKLEVGSSPNHLEIAEALPQRRRTRLEHPHMGLSKNVLQRRWCGLQPITKQVPLGLGIFGHHHITKEEGTAEAPF